MGNSVLAIMYCKNVLSSWNLLYDGETKKFEKLKYKPGKLNYDWEKTLKIGEYCTKNVLRNT